MAKCSECGAVKLIEKPCPKCGRMNNVGNPKPFTDAEKLENLDRGLTEFLGVPFVVDETMPPGEWELRGQTTVRCKVIT